MNTKYIESSTINIKILNPFLLIQIKSDSKDVYFFFHIFLISFYSNHKQHIYQKNIFWNHFQYTPFHFISSPSLLISPSPPSLHPHSTLFFPSKQTKQTKSQLTTLQYIRYNQIHSFCNSQQNN